MKQRNPQARALRDPRFRPRAVKPRKGRGSYTRKARSAKRADGPSATATTARPSAQQSDLDSNPMIVPSASRNTSWR